MQKMKFIITLKTFIFVSLFIFFDMSDNLLLSLLVVLLSLFTFNASESFFISEFELFIKFIF